MNLQQLREALKAGKITLEQFKEQAKAYLAAQLASKAMSQEDHDKEVTAVDAEPDPAGGGGGGGGAMTAEQIQAMIDKATQAAEDRIRGQYSKKLKDAEEEAERLRREKMTDEEKAKDDLAKAQKDLDEKTAALAKREVELHTVTALAKASIPDAFKDFLVADTVENTDARIASFQTVWAKALKDAVEAKFKAGGGNPDKGNGGGGGDVNPWKKETLNLTKQAEIMRTNPELAKTLMAAAGK